VLAGDLEPSLGFKRTRMAWGAKSRGKKERKVKLADHWEDKEAENKRGSISESGKGGKIEDEKGSKTNGRANLGAPLGKITGKKQEILCGGQKRDKQPNEGLRERRKIQQTI